MKSRFVLLSAILICASLFFGCDVKTTPDSTKKETTKAPSTSQTDSSTFEVGDYVQFGSYLDEPILWRVMEVENGKLMLWSEYILTAKCFDASESGTASVGEDNAQKYGSNVWSNSNIREWLNAEGSVSWSTQPPTEAAMWGNNAYESEEGFLTAFSDAEISQIVLTSREIKDSNDVLVETTQDRVFLASYSEVRDSGKWMLNQIGRTKTPTAKAMENNKNEYADIRLASFYYLDTQGTDSSAYQIYGVFDDGRLWVGDPNDSYSGIAPAMRISAAAPIGGDGTKENPWRY